MLLRKCDSCGKTQEANVKCDIRSYRLASVDCIIQHIGWHFEWCGNCLKIWDDNKGAILASVVDYYKGGDDERGD